MASTTDIGIVKTRAGRTLEKVLAGYGNEKMSSSMARIIMLYGEKLKEIDQKINPRLAKELKILLCRDVCHRLDKNNRFPREVLSYAQNAVKTMQKLPEGKLPKDPAAERLEAGDGKQ